MRLTAKSFSLLVPAVLALGAAAYLWWPDERPAVEPPPPVAARATPRPAPPPPLPAPEASPPDPAPASGPRFSQGAPFQLPPPIKRPPQVTTITAADVERDFAAAKTPGERAALAETIAAQRDPETFTILSRLYLREQVPSVREALIAGLIEVDEEEHTKAKLSLLAGALKKEPRNGRRAALEVLAQMDEPEAQALLKKAAKEDVDFQIREAAKAFIADQ